MSDLQVRGPLLGGTGAPAPFTADITGAQRITDAHGRFFEAASRGFLFSAGMTVTSISNVTFTTATLGATGTPIVGVWNPMNSGKNLSILQVRLQIVNTAATTTGHAGLMWCTSVNQSAITTGITPLSRLSLSSTGAVGKGYAGTALTGLSGSLVVQEVSGLSGMLPNYSFVQTAAGTVATIPSNIDNIDGAFVVPPGGVLALLCTTTPVAVSAASSIMWEEIPILT
jgi:hypothetical protein